MNHIYVLGDLHFSAMQKWNLPIGEKFLEWFESIDIEPNSELVQLGDIVETAVSPGKVIDQVYRWSQICKEKFKHVYIIQGNHDIKPWRSEEQSALEFLHSQSHCTVITRETVLKTDNGFSILGLPHITMPGQNLNDYFNTKMNKSFYEGTYDLVCGHTHYDLPDMQDSFLENGVKRELFNSPCFAFGHIHTRVAEDYVGSVWPNKISEERTDFPRHILCIEKDGNTTKTNKNKCIAIPEFVKYKEVEYPKQPGTDTSNKVIVYTVTNCTSLSFAKKHYSSLFIRGIQKPEKNHALQTKGISTTQLFKIEKPIDALNSFMVETKTTITRPLYKYLVELFT